MDDWFSNCGINLKLVLTESQKDILLKHAQQQSPNEACALLFGSAEDSKFVVKDVFLTENKDKSPSDFAISEKQLLEGYREAEKKKLEVIGIFHSHPHSEAFPSSKDKKFMEINPVSWLIFSGITKELKAFVLDKKITEIPIESWRYE